MWNAACIQPAALHVHPQYTAGALQFRLGHDKGRWAHFNVKLHFFQFVFPGDLPNQYCIRYRQCFKRFWPLCPPVRRQSLIIHFAREKYTATFSGSPNIYTSEFL